MLLPINCCNAACVSADTGTALADMRRELADSVNALFALPRPQPRRLDPESDEFKRLDRVVYLATLLRGAVERDRYKRDILSFQGGTPKEAYFVKCNSETTTQTDIDNGIVNIIVGFAPLKPAEFVIIKIQQIAGEL